MNKGLAELVKDSKRSASTLDNWFSSRNRTDIFAPEGKPLAIPITQAKLPAPGTLNKGRMIGSNMTPIKRTTPKAINNSAVIKNGNKEGKTTSSHICKPLTLASSDSSGNVIRAIVIKMTVLVKNNVVKIFLNV